MSDEPILADPPADEWRPTMHLRMVGHYGYSSPDLEQLWEKGDEENETYQCKWSKVRWAHHDETKDWNDFYAQHKEP